MIASGLISILVKSNGLSRLENGSHCKSYDGQNLLVMGKLGFKMSGTGWNCRLCNTWKRVVVDNTGLTTGGNRC